MKTERLGFSKWTSSDFKLAKQLWGEEEVTRYICVSGKFSDEDILNRLETEIHNDKLYHIQYWPIFELDKHEIIGCCGIRPFKDESHSYEIGFHLCKEYWGKGYAYEAAKAVIKYSFFSLKAEKLYAGHHPENNSSKKILYKLGFKYIGKNFYEPTGLYHPSYELSNNGYLEL